MKSTKKKKITKKPHAATRTLLKSSRFLVVVEGFASTDFKRVGRYDTSKGELILTRNLAVEDGDLTMWFGQKNPRAVMIHLLDDASKVVRSFNLGACHPVSYDVGPFDPTFGSGPIEESLTIRQNDPPIYQPPIKTVAAPPKRPEDAAEITAVDEAPETKN